MKKKAGSSNKDKKEPKVEKKEVILTKPSPKAVLPDKQEKKPVSKLAEMQKLALAKQASSIPSPNPPVKILGAGIIAEDPKAEEQSDGDHNLEVQKFYKAGINNMQRQGIITQNMNFPNRVNINE